MFGEHRKTVRNIFGVLIGKYLFENRLNICLFFASRCNIYASLFRDVILCLTLIFSCFLVLAVLYYTDCNIYITISIMRSSAVTTKNSDCTSPIVHVPLIYLSIT
jgi:hypothetical protein